MRQFEQRISTFPYYVFGTILFFLAHGYSENIRLLPFSGMLVFFWIAGAATALVLWLVTKKFGSIARGGIWTGALLIFYLFYGAIQDALKQVAFFPPIARYRVLLPGMFLALATLYLLLRRNRRPFRKATLYANTLCMVLLLVDGVSILSQVLVGPSGPADQKLAVLQEIVPCDSCGRPDVYLIVPDEYWGNVSLKQYFGYDNESFRSFLKKEGFFVVSHPSSNYASTPLSMASVFQMQYLGWLKDRRQVEAEDYGKAALAITHSAVVRNFQRLGYRIRNCSIFDLLDQPSAFNFGVLPIQMRLITAKTLLGTVEKDLLWHARVNVASHFQWLADRFQEKFREGNSRLLGLTYDELSKKDGPRFVYTHLMMPHFPCLYDSSGHATGLNFFSDLPQKTLDSAYLGYLIYANHILTALISEIKAKSGGRAVILLMSDHGYRDFRPGIRGGSADNNFNAVYLPGGNYTGFYDSISNVNQFRALFNTLFDQRLPMLKDSIVL